MQAWTGGELNIGALVFWPNAAYPFGHVAIYVGNGYVMSTQGTGASGTQMLPVARLQLPISYLGTPSGWVSTWDV